MSNYILSRCRECGYRSVELEHDKSRIISDVRDCPHCGKKTLETSSKTL